MPSRLLGALRKMLSTLQGQIELRQMADLPQDHLGRLAGTDYHLLLELVALGNAQLLHRSNSTELHV